MAKGKNRAKKKEKKKQDGLLFIKDCLESNKISVKEVETLSEINYPLFSFKYLKDNSIKDCVDADFLLKFIMRLRALSNLGWAEIRQAQRHGFGMEPLPQSELVPDTKLLPKFITPEVNLDVFRSNRDNRTFVGFQKGKIFYIFYIESVHGEICKH